MPVASFDNEKHLAVRNTQKITMVLSGGLGLGSYQASVYEALSFAPHDLPCCAGTRFKRRRGKIVAHSRQNQRVTPDFQ